MSTIKEMLEALQTEIDTIDASIRQIDDDINEMQAEKQEMMRKKSVVDEKVSGIKCILGSVQESFNTLLTVSAAGSLTSSDLKTFADTVGLDVSEEFIDQPMPVELPELHTG